MKKKEIEVELQHGEWETRTVKVKEETFVMATDVAFNIMNELGGNCMGVYLTILKHRNTKNNRCFPSIQLLTKETNLNRKTINACLGKLEQAGYLVINSGYKGTNSNYYFPQEAFYELFEDDICQNKASRRHGKSTAITEKRETKEQKEIRRLKEENERLKRNQEINFSSKDDWDDLPF